ncbi:hypothetical protein ARMGADRAFT_1033826 [Armillaria gallica]|uniref:Uncharacterized protein n=1 Tax=Armillaria gallica TaxID=47427 RepID=A0A2H3DBR3_ARMGA|nr:hypothetical protein ARMGADRAFT_1033826 [Armillaria gallica]
MPSIRTPTTQEKNCTLNSSQSTRMRGKIHTPNSSRASSVLVIKADGKNKTVSSIKDVIEISSDEEETSMMIKDRKIMELRNDIKKLKKLSEPKPKLKGDLHNTRKSWKQYEWRLSKQKKKLKGKLHNTDKKSKSCGWSRAELKSIPLFLNHTSYVTFVH